MNITIQTELLKQAFNEDPEFRLMARFWDGALEFKIGDVPYVATLSQGEVVSISHEGSRDNEPRHVVISAPVEDWAMLLQDPPPPFYHDFYPATVWHGFQFGGDNDYLWAYYAAIRRSAEILRAVAKVEGV
jgi:hypothetical protein